MPKPGYLNLRLTPEREGRILVLANQLGLNLPQPRPSGLSYRLTDDRKEMADQIATRLNLETDSWTSVIDFALNLAVYHFAKFHTFVANYEADLRADELVIDFALAWTLAEG
jgi:hypothetical protein